MTCSKFVEYQFGLQAYTMYSAYNHRWKETLQYALGSFTLHFGLKYEIIYQLDAIEYLFVFFQLETCFELIRPSSGVMDVTISLHMQHMVSLV